MIGEKKSVVTLVNLSHEVRLDCPSRKTFPGSWPEPLRVNHRVSRSFTVAFRDVLQWECAAKVVFREKDRLV